MAEPTGRVKQDARPWPVVLHCDDGRGALSVAAA